LKEKLGSDEEENELETIKELLNSDEENSLFGNFLAYNRQPVLVRSTMNV